MVLGCPASRGAAEGRKSTGSTVSLMQKLQTRLSRRRQTSVARAVGTLALLSALASMLAQADPPTPPRTVRIAPDSGSTATAPLFVTPRSLRSSGMMEKPGWSHMPLGFIENQGQAIRKWRSIREPAVRPSG